MLLAGLLLALCCHITVCSLVSTVFICPAFDFTGLKCKFPDSLVSELIYKRSQCSRRSGVCFLLWACVLMLFCMCPYTYMCVSLCYHACVLILTCVCPYAIMYVSSCYYVCVLILICVCPYASMRVSLYSCACVLIIIICVCPYAIMHVSLCHDNITHRRKYTMSVYTCYGVHVDISS